jgi:hypothetical protein
LILGWKFGEVSELGTVDECSGGESEQVEDHVVGNVIDLLARSVLTLITAKTRDAQMSRTSSSNK